MNDARGDARGPDVRGEDASGADAARDDARVTSSRRNVLAWLATAPVATALSRAVLPATLLVETGCDAGHAPRAFGPWPARPGSDRMSVWIESGSDALLHAELFDADGTLRTTASFEPLSSRLALATFTGLAPDTAYSFRVLGRDGSSHEGTFRTLPTRSGRVRLALGADIHPANAPYAVFDHVRDRDPHLFVGLGDHVYADADPDAPIAPADSAYDALYRRGWSDASLDACWSSVASLLVWDDHDVIDDFDGSTDATRRRAATDAYLHFQRSRAASAKAWSIVDVGPASLFLMDTRTYRSPNAAEDDASKSMLGAEQLAALLDFLATSTADVVVLASPTPFHFYANTGADGWAEGFSSERAIVFDAIAARPPGSVVLVSGDLHYPTVVENSVPGGGTAIELGCTPLAAFPREYTGVNGPGLLYLGEGECGFGLLTIDGGTTPPSIEYAWIDDTGRERFRWSPPAPSA